MNPTTNQQQNQRSSPQVPGIPYTTPPAPQNPITPPIGQPTDPKQQANAAAGNLGFINTMQEHLLKHKAGKQQAIQPQETPHKPPQQEQTSNPTEDMKTEIKGSEERIMDEIKALKEEMTKNSPDGKQKEIDDLRKQIQEVLDAPDSEDSTDKKNE